MTLKAKPSDQGMQAYKLGKKVDDARIYLRLLQVGLVRLQHR